MFNEQILDNELKVIDPNTEEGLAKIEKAKKLLPKHYNQLIDDIGGPIHDEFDMRRLPSNVRKMVDIFQVEAPALGLHTNIMVATMAYTNLFGKFRPFIRSTTVSRKTDIPANVFAMVFAQSGMGKDASFNLGLDILKNADDLIMQRIELDAEENCKRIAMGKNRKAQEKEGVPSADIVVDDDTGWEQYFEKPHTGSIKMATYEGLLAAAEMQVKNGKYGNLFIGISELGNSLKLDPNIDRALMVVAEMYDTGSVAEDLKKTKELKTGAIEGLGLSLLAHTSPAPLIRNPKVAEQVNNLQGSYFGRRAFTLFSANNEFLNNIELWDDLDAQVDAMAEQTHRSVDAINELQDIASESVARVLNGTELNMITLTEEAAMMYNKYLLLNKWYRMLVYFRDEEFMYEGVLPELINRHWKAVKLAGIWALAQNKSVIDKDILSSAIYFTEFVGRGLRQLMYVINLETHERFIKAIEERDIVDSIRFDMLIKQSYVKRADKNQIISLLTAVNSALQGKAVARANYEKAVIEVTRIKESTGEYGVSYLPFKAGDSKEYRTDQSYKNFKYTKIKLPDLIGLLKGDYAYSPFKFKDGYRSNANIMSTTNYVVLDVDESIIEFDILHETYLSGTSHIIATTSDANNKFKFRIILPIKQELGSDTSIYRYVLQRIADELMLTIDNVPISQPIFSYSGSKILDNLAQKIEPMDISNFIKDSATDVITNKYESTLTKAQQTKEQGIMFNDFEDAFGFAIFAKTGQGSISLFNAGRKMKQAGLTHQDIKLMLHKINNTWKNPMQLKRLEKIINQFEDTPTNP